MQLTVIIDRKMVIMKNLLTFISMVLMTIVIISGSVNAEQTVKLSTINWEPYSGEKLPNHGFFSELVTESFARAGYLAEFHYRPWARALKEAKKGKFDGVMDAYWKEDRTEFLNYSDVVWKVKEEFIALRDNSVTWNGTLASLKGYQIGVLNKSLQAEEIEAAGIKTQPISDQVQNVKKLLAGRIDAMVIPSDVFFWQLEQIDSQFDRSRIKILKPPFKIYDMYVAFSKKKPGYEQLTADFNRGLDLIKADGTFKKILQKHNITLEE